MSILSGALLLSTLLSCSSDGSVERGASAFDAGKLDEAIAAWSEASASGGRPSGIVSYNLGVAWYRKGDPPRAIAALRAAKMLRPRDSNVHHNLALARSELGLVPAPVSDTCWTQVLTPGELGLLGALSAALGSLGAVLSLLRARKLEPPSLLWLALWLAGIIAAGFGWREISRQERHPVAVVADGEASVRDAADINAGERFRFPAGTETRVEREHGEFLLVEDSRGRRGWVARGAVVLAR